MFWPKHLLTCLIFWLHEVNGSGNKNGNNVMQSFVKKMYIKNGPLEASPSEDYWKQITHWQSVGPMRTTYELECFESNINGQKIARINNGPTSSECKALQLDVADCEQIKGYIRVAYFVKQLALDRDRYDRYFYQIYVVFPNLEMYYGLDVKSSKSQLNEALHCDPDVDISTKWESTDFTDEKITPMWKSKKDQGDRTGGDNSVGKIGQENRNGGHYSIVKKVFSRKNNERPLSRKPPTDAWKKLTHWNYVDDRWTHYDIHCYEANQSGQKIARLSTGFPSDDNEYILQMEITDCDKIKDSVGIGPLEKEGNDHYFQVYVLQDNVCKYYRHITGMSKFELDRDDDPCSSNVNTPFSTTWTSAELEDPREQESTPGLGKLDTFKYGDKYGVSQSPVVKVYERVKGEEPLPTTPPKEDWKKLTHCAYTDEQHGHTLYDMNCYQSVKSGKLFARLTNGIPRDDEYKLLQMEVTDCNRIADFVEVTPVIKDKDEGNYYFQIYVILQDNCMFYKLITKYAKQREFDESKPCGREMKVTTPWEDEMKSGY